MLFSRMLPLPVPLSKNKIVALESEYMQNISSCSGSMGDTYPLGEEECYS